MERSRASRAVVILLEALFNVFEAHEVHGLHHPEAATRKQKGQPLEGWPFYAQINDLHESDVERAMGAKPHPVLSRKALKNMD